ncbi:hypothetical protein ACHQM5_003567 [Ranunculus cassubicifolius]
MAFSRVLRIKPLLNHRLFSSITQPDSAIHKQKIQSALSLLGSKNNNPAEQILYVCLSNTISDLPPPSPSNPIHSFLHELNTQPALMSSFLEELKTQPDFRKERMYSHIITVYGQAGMFDSAIKTFEEMPAMGITPSAESLNALLGAGLHTDKIFEVNKIFTDYPKYYGITRDVDTYNILLKAYIAWGYYKYRSMILLTLDVMNKEGCKPDDTTYKTFLAGLYKEKPEEVVNVIEFMEQNNMFLDNIDIYNFGIETLCKLKKPAEAKRLFEKITSRGTEPNTGTYKHLIRCFGSEGNVQEVRWLAEDMHLNEVEIDRDCYEYLMECLCQGGDHETALQTCKNCMKKEWFPSVFTSQIAMVKTLVNELVTSSNHEEVEKMLQMMETHGLRPNLDIYNLCMESLYKLDKSKDAKALFGRMLSRGVKPNANTYQLLISGYTKEGNVKEIKRITAEMRENGVEPDASCHKALIKNISQSGDPEAVYQACKDCMTEEWFPSFLFSDPVTLKSLVEKLLGDSRQEEVGELLGRMENLGLQPSHDIYNFVIQKLYELDESDDAKEFFQMVSKRGVKLNVDTYWSVIQELSSEGNTDEMKSLFDDMIEKGVEPDQRICSQLMQDLCDEEDDYTTAFLVCRKCVSMPWFPNFISTNLATLTTLIYGLVDESLFDEIKELLDAMEKNRLILCKIYSITLDKLCLNEESGEAVKIYDRASAIGIKLDEGTYRSLVELFSVHEDAPEELEKVLADMSKKGVEIDSDCYENIIESLCDGKGVETALQVTYDCMPKKWYADFLSGDTSTIETLVVQLKKESKYEEVWKLLEAMKKNGLQPNLQMFFQ